MYVTSDSVNKNIVFCFVFRQTGLCWRRPCSDGNVPIRCRLSAAFPVQDGGHPAKHIAIYGRHDASQIFWNGGRTSGLDGTIREKELRIINIKDLNTIAKITLIPRDGWNDLCVCDVYLRLSCREVYKHFRHVKKWDNWLGDVNSCLYYAC